MSQCQILNCSSANQTVIPILITLVAKQNGNDALLYAVAQEMMAVEEIVESDVNITIEAVQRFGNCPV